MCVACVCVYQCTIWVVCVCGVRLDVIWVCNVTSVCMHVWCVCYVYWCRPTDKGGGAGEGRGGIIACFLGARWGEGGGGCY